MQVLVGLETALKVAGLGGYVYVMTDSPRMENTSSILNIYSRIERYGNQVSFILTPNGDNCAAVLDDYLVYSEIARFSGGQLYNLNTKNTVAQALATLPSIYMSARSQERIFDDCSMGQVGVNDSTAASYIANVQDVALFVDSHMASATITVNGHTPRIDISNNAG